jgi:hypothetical protein
MDSYDVVSKWLGICFDETKKGKRGRTASKFNKCLIISLTFYDNISLALWVEVQMNRPPIIHTETVYRPMINRIGNGI